jgi:hypothetical protein
MHAMSDTSFGSCPTHNVVHHTHWHTHSEFQGTSLSQSESTSCLIHYAVARACVRIMRPDTCAHSIHIFNLSGLQPDGIQIEASRVGLPKCVVVYADVAVAEQIEWQLSFKHEKQKVSMQHLFSLWLNNCTITPFRRRGWASYSGGRLRSSPGSRAWARSRALWA